MSNVTYARRKSRGKSLNFDWDEVVTRDVEALRWANTSRNAISEGLLQRALCPKEQAPRVNFCTSSSYDGEWDSIGMCGFGKYVFMHGVEYRGQLWDGMFHGEGILTYPAGQSLEGIWEKGNLISYRSRFADGLTYTDPWDYCQMPDRKFFVSKQGGFNPAGEEFLTQQQPTRDIPAKCYDMNDSFYDPQKECVLNDNFEDSAVDRSDIPVDKIINGHAKFNTSRVPDQQEKDWIIAHCRKAWDESTGYRPDLFEYWTSGRRMK